MSRSKEARDRQDAARAARKKLAEGLQQVQSGVMNLEELKNMALKVAADFGITIPNFHMTPGIRALKLPEEALIDIGIQFEKLRNLEGATRRSFAYWPADIYIPGGKKARIVVSIFNKAIKLAHGRMTKPGDVGLTLRSEWNIRENPLD